jgi:hypothetical protein
LSTLYIGNKTFALYSAKELTESVKFSLRHRNKKMAQVAASRSVDALIAAEDAPKALDEFLALSIDRANRYIDINDPQTHLTLIGLGTAAFFVYGLFLVGTHFGLLWAIVTLPLAIIALLLACLSLMLLTAILWGAIWVLSPETLADLKTVLNGTINGTHKDSRISD